MPINITMPRLSDTMEEGTLVGWRVKVGDEVAAGDALADVETDKATMELQTFDDGKVAKLMIDEGETTSVGALICVLAGEGESVEDAAANAEAGGGASEKGGESGEEAPTGDEEQASQEQSPEETDTEEAGQEPEEASETSKTQEEVQEPERKPTSAGGEAKRTHSGRIKASPLARRMAEEAGLDLASLQGTGPDGRIIKRDVLNAQKQPRAKAQPDAASGAPAAESGATPPVAAPTAPAATLEEKFVKLSNMRKTIAKRLVESKTTVPHFQVSVAINTDPLLELRKTVNSQLEPQGIKLSVNDFVTRAAALAALQHPEINASWDGEQGGIQYHGSVNVGTAIALPAERGGGLVVATVRDVQHKGLRQINNEVKSLAKKARESGLSLEEMADSTLTISNLGMPQYGVTQFTAIINPPNAAIIAVGAALQKPVVRDGELTVGTQMNMTLSGDHRVIDGALAAEYLSTMRGLLENPAALLV